MLSLCVYNDLYGFDTYFPVLEELKLQHGY